MKMKLLEENKVRKQLKKIHIPGLGDSLNQVYG